MVRISRSPLPSQIIVSAYLLTALLLASGCSQDHAKEQPDQHSRQMRYTIVNLWFHDGTHFIHNFTQGTLVPLGTRFVIEQVEDRIATVRLPDSGNQVYRIFSTKSLSGNPLDKLLDERFATHPPDMSVFGAEVRSAILGGQIKPGMTKKEVLMARGFPPSVDYGNPLSRVWKYWDSVMNFKLVVFDDDSRVIDVL